MNKLLTLAKQARQIAEQIPSQLLWQQAERGIRVATVDVRAQGSDDPQNIAAATLGAAAIVRGALNASDVKSAGVFFQVMPFGVNSGTSNGLHVLAVDNWLMENRSQGLRDLLAVGHLQYATALNDFMLTHDGNDDEKPVLVFPNLLTHSGHDLPTLAFIETLAGGRMHITQRQLTGNAVTYTFKNENAHTPLMHALAQLFPECPRETTQNGSSPLVTASRDGRPHVLQRVIQANSPAHATLLAAYNHGDGFDSYDAKGPVNRLYSEYAKAPTPK